MKLKQILNSLKIIFQLHTTDISNNHFYLKEIYVKQNKNYQRKATRRSNAGRFFLTSDTCFPYCTLICTNAGRFSLTGDTCFPNCTLIGSSWKHIKQNKNYER